MVEQGSRFFYDTVRAGQSSRKCLPLFSSTRSINRPILARRYAYSSTVPFLPTARFFDCLCFDFAVCPVIFVVWVKAVVGATVYRVKALATVVALVTTSTPSSAGSLSTM